LQTVSSVRQTISSMFYVYPCLIYTMYPRVTWMSAPKTVANWEADEVFLRSVSFPEKDRYLHTTAPWKGEFR
jgi:hypothetical protein